MADRSAFDVNTPIGQHWNRRHIYEWYNRKKGGEQPSGTFDLVFGGVINYSLLANCLFVDSSLAHIENNMTQAAKTNYLNKYGELDNYDFETGYIYWLNRTESELYGYAPLNLKRYKTGDLPVMFGWNIEAFAWLGYENFVLKNVTTGDLSYPSSVTPKSMFTNYNFLDDNVFGGIWDIEYVNTYGDILGDISGMRVPCACIKEEYISSIPINSNFLIELIGTGLDDKVYINGNEVL